MRQSDPQAIKELLYALCESYISRRIDTAITAIASAREAAAGEGKSSAGDKYETTREMMQQEISRNELLLAEARKLKTALGSVPRSAAAESVQSGSIVLTDRGNFYISVSAGALQAGGREFTAIAATSPLGRMLAGKKTGDTVTFNSARFELSGVF